MGNACVFRILSWFSHSVATNVARIRLFWGRRSLFPDGVLSGRLSSVTANPFSTFATSTVFQNRFSEVSAPTSLSQSARQLGIGWYTRFVPVTAGPSWVDVCNQRGNGGIRCFRHCVRTNQPEAKTVERRPVNMKMCHDAIKLGLERNPFRLMIGLVSGDGHTKRLHYCNKSTPNTMVWYTKY